MRISSLYRKIDDGIWHEKHRLLLRLTQTLLNARITETVLYILYLFIVFGGPDFVMQVHYLLYYIIKRL